MKIHLETLALFLLTPFAVTQTRPPNFIVILNDDLGYGDIQPFGGSIPTPHLNRMAHDGLVATDYYAPANICTPSRAGLLTGRYPVRTGLCYEVILNGDDRVLPTSERTIPDDCEDCSDPDCTDLNCGGGVKASQKAKELALLKSFATSLKYITARS